MQTIRIKRVMPQAKQEQLGGRFAEPGDYDLLITEDANILKPDGTPLLIFRKKILPPDLCKTAYSSLHGAAAPTSNRGMAGGAVDNRTREYRIRQDVEWPKDWPTIIYPASFKEIGIEVHH